MENNAQNAVSKSTNTLIIAGITFQLNTKTRDTAFFLDETDGGRIEFSLDISFQRNTFEDETTTPSLCINPFETRAKSLDKLIGKKFKVKNMEESDEREDSFYLFEHEPLERYELTIIAVSDSHVRVQCSGIAVTDGYADPYESASFELDCCLPIITDASDWKKYGI